MCYPCIMLEDHPLVTIGLTCHNAAHRIQNAIACAQKQTWPNLEILVVDDGSEDGSPEVIQTLAKDDPRIRLVTHEKNKGTAETRTTIAKNTNGEFLCFFDDDDESSADRVQKQWERLTSYEQEHEADIVFCYSNRSIIRKDGTKADKIGYGIGHCAPEPHGPPVVDLILWNGGYDDYEPSRSGLMGSCSMFFRTKVFNQLGYFDKQFWRCAEIDFAIRAAFAGAHFISVNEPLLMQIKTRSANKAGKRPLLFALLLCKKYKAHLKSKRVYLASIAIAHMRFYSKKRNIFIHYFSYFMACLLSPDKVLAGTLKRRFARKKQTMKRIKTARSQ